MRNESVIGIYYIINTVNNKYYVGSSKHIERRFLEHKNKLRAGRHYNEHLQNAWDKYAEDSFEFKVVELCEEESLIELEQHYLDGIKDWKSCYNICSHVLAPSKRGVHHIYCSKDERNGKWRLRLNFSYTSDSRVTARLEGVFSTKEEAEKEEIKLNTKYKSFSREESYAEILRIKKENKDSYNKRSGMGIKRLANGRWQVKIVCKDQHICCGAYSTEEEARAIRLKAEQAYWWGNGDVKDLKNLIDKTRLDKINNFGKGVYTRPNGTFYAKFYIKKKQYNSGSFATREEAVSWREDMEQKFWF